MAADLHEFGGREELQVGGISQERVDQRPFVDDERIEAPAAGFKAASQPDWPGSDDDNVQHNLWGLLVANRTPRTRHRWGLFREFRVSARSEEGGQVAVRRA